VYRFQSAHVGLGLSFLSISSLDLARGKPNLKASSSLIHFPWALRHWYQSAGLNPVAIDDYPVQLTVAIRAGLVERRKRVS
jgi:hypothetical protein